MTKTDILCLKTIGESVERSAGQSVKEQVMEGSQQITTSSSKAKVAAWAKAAIDRLDLLIDEETRIQIMENCGHMCASHHTRVGKQAKARRAKYSSEEEFLEAERQRPARGTRLERECNTLYQYYTPRNSYGRRCFCFLFNATDDTPVVSPTYCHCAKGFVKAVWEQALGRPVTVDLLQSSLLGAQECKFAIHL